MARRGKTSVQVTRSVNALGVFIRQRLDDMGMTRDEFAVRLGVSRATAFRLMSLNGEMPKHVTTERLERVAQVLDVSADGLATLWPGRVIEVVSGTRDELVRSFLLATHDLTDAEVRHALEVAQHAVAVIRERHKG